MPNKGFENLLIANFLDANGATTATIDNWTSFNLHNDFFHPAASFSLTIGDDRMYELNAQLQLGMAIEFSLQLSTGVVYPVMIGYITDYDLQYEHGGKGQELVITGHDLLGWMSDQDVLPSAFLHTTQVTTSSIPDTYEQTLKASPNLDLDYSPSNSTQIGQSVTPIYTTSQVQTSLFNEKTTFAQAFQYIFTAFTAQAQLPKKINLSFDDSASTSVQSGGRVGPKTGNKGTQKAITNAIGHLLRPNNHETYLAYALRLAKHIGCNIKLAPFQEVDGSQTVFISPPTYDRTTPPLYNLVHTMNQPAGRYDNNILKGKFKFDLKSQPSVIIMEAAGNGSGIYYQSAVKAVAINEITGYQLPGDVIGNGVTVTKFGQVPIPNVLAAVSQLTKGPNGSGYYRINPNTQLLNAIQNIVLSVQTQLSLAKYMQDNNAHNVQELLIGCQMNLAEAQDKFLVVSYHLDGWDNNGYVWANNTMCQVYDEAIQGTLNGNPADLGAPLNTELWVKKVSFTKSREGGVHTDLELTLPYTHNFDHIPQVGVNSTASAGAIPDTWQQTLNIKQPSSLTYTPSNESLGP